MMMLQFPLLLICTSLVAAAQFNDEFVSFKRNFNKVYDDKEEVSKQNLIHFVLLSIKDKSIFFT